MNAPTPAPVPPANSGANGIAPDAVLFETIHYDPQMGVPLIEYHLERLKHSAAALGFECDRHAIRNEVQAVCFTHREPARLRIELNRDGASTILLSALPEIMEEPVAVAPVPHPCAADDPRLVHKTSDRAFYEHALAEAQRHGAKEAVLVRDGTITEGSFTNVFVERDDMLLTPPLSLGLLPGVLRRSLIEDGKAREAELSIGDLADGFLIGNALRGLIRARLVKA